MNKWQQLCKRLNKKYKSEIELEGRFEDCLYFILGWSDKNVARQMMVQFGHESKRTDLVLLDDDSVPIVVIEMKSQNVPITEHEIGQLHSYMRQELIPFGLLVGERISLYYDDQKRGNKPRRVLNLSFKDIDNTDGIELANLLDKPTFSLKRLSEFCDNYLIEKEKLEKDLGSKVVIDNLANFRNLDTGKDEKIRQLIDLYSLWLSEDKNRNKKEYQYLQSLKENRAWIAENILNTDLRSLSNDDFLQRFRELSLRLPNLTRYLRMWNKDDKEVLSIRQGFENAISHLTGLPKSHRYNALDDFTRNSQFAVKHLKNAFWSEMIRIKFKDVPLLNNKTERFFDAIGVYIGDTYEEKLKNVSNFYSRFSGPNMDLDMLSHLEHFALAKNAKNETGREFVMANFLENEH